MPRRTIMTKSLTSSTQLGDLVASQLALEVLAPSPTVYLFSPWITDLAIVPAKRMNVRALFPESLGDVWLSMALNRLAERGAEIRIICRPDPDNTEPFLRKLSPRIQVARKDTTHIKGLFTSHGVLTGSMNFTYRGLRINDERVDLDTDPEQVRRSLLEAGEHWKKAAS